MTREALPGPEKKPDEIPMLRGHIDALDEVIIRLIAERTKLSARIQTVRINSGGSRVEIGRERDIRNAYRVLGPDGPLLADAILTVGRGQLPGPEPAMRTADVVDPGVSAANAGQLEIPQPLAVPRMAAPPTQL